MDSPPVNWKRPNSCRLLICPARIWKWPYDAARAKKSFAKLALPVNERAAVAAELLASLDAEDPAEVEAACAAEIERRARRVISGESQGLPWEDVRARAEAELRKR